MPLGGLTKNDKIFISPCTSTLSCSAITPHSELPGYSRRFILGRTNTREKSIVPTLLVSDATARPV